MAACILVICNQGGYKNLPNTVKAFILSAIHCQTFRISDFKLSYCLIVILPSPQYWESQLVLMSQQHLAPQLLQVRLTVGSLDQMGLPR